MKLLLVITLFILSLHANHLDSNTTIDVTDNNATKAETSEKDQETNDKDEQEIIVVKDESGLSDDAVRKKAKESDAKKRGKVAVTDVVESIDESGNVDISKIQEKWEDLSPSPIKYDWVKTKSGEWFKGEIKSLFNDDLEFDSDEVGLYTFDFDDVVEIKSYHIISLNIENLATFPGILRLKNKKITIIQGENSYEFEKKDVISFAPAGDHERNFWSGKASVSFDLRSGNTNQYDYTAQVNFKRSTASTRLTLEYLGRITRKDNEETANDHRVNQKYDRYLSKSFFWTPLFTEYYTDRYKNISQQLTAGLGVGYTLIDRKKTTWNISGGPALLYTRYDTVVLGSDISNFSPALQLSTKYELELNKITDITYSYKLTLTQEGAGRYKHHMLVTFENEITSWLDLDITGIWDYILEPEKISDGSTPEKSDFQLLFGIGIEF